MNNSKESPDNRDSSEIQEDIRATRGDMDRTIDSLNERLSPRALIGGVMDWFENRPSSPLSSGPSRTSDLLQTVRDNPVPVVLTGIGITWLLAESKKNGYQYAVSDRQFRPAENYRHNLRQSYGAGGIHTEAVRTADYDSKNTENSSEPGPVEVSKDKLSDISGKVSDTFEKSKEGVSDFGDKVSGRTSQGMDSIRSGFTSAQDSISSGFSSAQDSMGSGYASAQNAVGDMSSKISNGFQDNYRVVDKKFRQAVDDVPLGVGLGFLGLGVLAGLLLPRTEVEDELMGDAADDLKTAAGEKGGDLVERGKRVASRVAEKATEEADNQGLTPKDASGAAGTLSDKVGSVVKAVKEEGKEAAKDEGLTAEKIRSEAEQEADKLASETEDRLRN